MAQNRNKLLDLFIGNLSNTIVHKILEAAIENQEIANKYEKELTTSFAIAMRYREKINPTNGPLSEKDQASIKKRIMKRVRTELMIRISKGYENIRLESVQEIVNRFLKEGRVMKK